MFSVACFFTVHEHYDMVLNSDRVGREKCVQIMKEYIKIKFGEIPDEKV